MLIDGYLFSWPGLRTVQLTRNKVGTSSVSPVLAVGLEAEYAVDQVLFMRSGQLFAIPLAGGESFQISQNFPLDIQSFKFFQRWDNSLHILCVMDVYPGMSPQQTADIDHSKESSAHTSGIVFDNLMVRHWDTWNVYQKRNHVFVCPVEVSADGVFNINGTHAVDIMMELHTDCPGKAVGLGEEEYTVSPDGNTVAFAARRPTAENTHRHDMAWCTDVPIYTIDISKYGSWSVAVQERPNPVIVSEESWVGYNSQPSFSADGSKLAFLSMKRAQYESDQCLLRILDIQTNTLSIVSENLLVSVSSIEWGLSDANTIYSTVQYRGSNRIMRFRLQYDSNNSCSLKSVDIMRGDESRSFPLLVRYSPSHNQAVSTEGMYFFESTLQSPNELVFAVVSADSDVFVPFDEIYRHSHTPAKVGEVLIAKTPGCGRFRYQIYNPTPEFTNGDIMVSAHESHYLRGGNNDLVHAWYLPPTRTSTARQHSVPLLLIIHGGPQVRSLT
jgi:hypothetical protein